MKATGILVILLSQDGFESDCPETKFQTITLQIQFEKVTVQKSIAELWTVISNQIIKYQLSHTYFLKLVIIKREVCLYEKLSNKQLAQAAIKILSSCLWKLDRGLFLKYGFKSDCLEKL